MRQNNWVSFFHTRRHYFAWFAATLFYFYQYVLRVAPGIMIDDIRRHFQIRGDEFATLGSIYLLSYALLQLPLGILLDKYGVKKVFLISVVMCILGSFSTAVAGNFLVMQIARCLIGMGSAVAFVTALKIVADNCNVGQRGLFVGLTLTIGIVGAISAAKIVSALLNLYEWQYIWQIAAVMGIVMLVIAFVAIPDTKQLRIEGVPSKKNGMQQWSEILHILQEKNIIMYAILSIGLYSPLVTLSDLWGTAFFGMKCGLARSDATQINMMLYLGMAIGSLILPWFFEKKAMLNLGIRFSTFAMLVLVAFILYVPAMKISILAAALVATGIFCGAEMMCFTAALRGVNQKHSGMVIGVVNTLNMVGSAVLIQYVGYLLDSSWDGQQIDGLRIYSENAFIMALSTLTLVLFICWIISFWLDKRQR